MWNPPDSQYSKSATFKMPTIQGKHWTGTLFPPCTEEQWREKMASIEAVVWSAQVETAPTTGTEHLQWYFETRKRRGIGCIKCLLTGAHVEVARSPRAAFDYCTKEESRTGWSAHEGQPRGQGTRSDIAAAAAMVREEGVQAVAEHMPDMVVRYARGLQALQTLHQSHQLMQWRDIQVHVRWGPTGTGKTRYAAELGDIFPLELDAGFWFDGYTGQTRLLVDEFYGQLKPSTLLKLLDGYKRLWPIKGGHVLGVWREVYITSNTPPDTWYSTERVPGAVLAALNRRFTTITHVEPEPADGVAVDTVDEWGYLTAPTQLA